MISFPKWNLRGSLAGASSGLSGLERLFVFVESACLLVHTRGFGCSQRESVMVSFLQVVHYTLDFVLFYQGYLKGREVYPSKEIYLLSSYSGLWPCL